MQLGDAYKGEDGGLYGASRNEPPAPHLRAALRESSIIRPLDREGRASSAGLIGLLAVGFSNTRQEFGEFVRLARLEPRCSPAVMGVNGGQSHMGSGQWARAAAADPSTPGGPWRVLDERLRRSGLAPPQVQVAWVKATPRRPSSLGGFPTHSERTTRDLAAILTTLRRLFPNLRIAYLSSRCYAGYAGSSLSPEPYAFESAFAVRRLIQDQISGDPDLSYASDRTPPNAPLLLWGPYLWADGASGRACDGLVWAREDFTGEGTHPSRAGAVKVAQLLLAFMKTDPTARRWFLR